MKLFRARILMRPGAPLWIALIAGVAVASPLLAAFPPAGWSRAEALILQVALALAALVCAAMLVRSVVMPMRIVARGFAMLHAQGLTDRLRRVGEANADRIVDLFNSIIDSLRAERVHNREQEAFLSQLLHAAPMGVLLLDYDGRTAMLNPAFAELAGIPADAVVRGLTPGQLPSGFASQIAAVPTGESRTLRQGDRNMYRCTHGEFRQHGFPRSFYILEQLTEEVRRAERRAYETVIRTLAHEVNNTMGGVRSALELMADTLPEQELCDIAASCAERCTGLSSFINAYADVVRVPEPQLHTADVRSMLESLVPFLHRMGGEYVAIATDFPPHPVEALMDEALMQQVVVNVVKNAIESMPPEGGEVRISASRGANGAAHIEIANNGAPLPPDTSENLFRPFFSTKRDGRGLGLTLSGEILERHKAVFSLRTGADGITRFSIDLPA